MGRGAHWTARNRLIIELLFPVIYVECHHPVRGDLKTNLRNYQHESLMNEVWHNSYTVLILWTIFNGLIYIIWIYIIIWWQQIKNCCNIHLFRIKTKMKHVLQYTVLKISFIKVSFSPSTITWSPQNFIFINYRGELSSYFDSEICHQFSLRKEFQ